MSKRSIEELVKNYRSGFSLEQAFYVSNEVFEYEWEYIFRKQWRYAGTTARIPKAGDYFLYQLQNDSIIIIRGNNEEVYAHYNTCWHRGSAICLNESGHVAKLICPYHQWVYDKDGSLLNARMMPDDFDTQPYSLHSVHVRVTQTDKYQSIHHFIR
jgi:Rieske 2Fe-2S family protein